MIIYNNKEIKTLYAPNGKKVIKTILNGKIYYEAVTSEETRDNSNIETN